MSQFNNSANPPWARELTLGNRQQQQQQLNLATLMSQASGANAGTFSLQNALQQTTLQQKQQQPQLPSFGIAALQFTSNFQPSQPSQQQIQLSSFQPSSVQSLQLGQPTGVVIPSSTLTAGSVSSANFTPQQNQRVFTGTVTKLHDNFGFVDEDVFFELSSVRGSRPQSGDRVLVEATYNANMPFKWNATRIQVLPSQTMVQQQSQQQQQQQQQASSMMINQSQVLSKPANQLQSASQALVANLASQLQSQVLPLMAQTIANTNNSAVGSGGSRFGQLPNKLSPGLLKAESLGMFRGRERRLRERTRDKRDKSPRRRASISPRRSRSPRRSAEPLQYAVQIPKLSLDTNSASVITLKARYSNLYIPSDFFFSHFAWTETFLPANTFHLGQSCSFHVMDKGVQAPHKCEAILEPDDVNHTYSAKVMLLCMPPMETLYSKSCGTGDDFCLDDMQHPARLIQFLVGQRGRNEPMAIGGAWSPSLDGPNPQDDPGVLIRTAVRTVLALTGIDLSRCSKWYRFAEVRYLRQEETIRGGRTLAARVETVVIFLPDVWSCLPTALEWEQTRIIYRQMGAGIEPEASDDLLQALSAKLKDKPIIKDSPTAKQEQLMPTHYSKLDPKTMKLADLQSELEARNQNSKGLKSQLIARLTKIIRSEEEEENIDGKPMKIESDRMSDVDLSDEGKKRQEDDEEKRREREAQYRLPDSPSIIVHPSTTAKGGKFDCAVVSLSVLLDYRPEDNKEHSFEVSLFAELFNEMLMRDFALSIYKCLHSVPEKLKDDDMEVDNRKGADEEDSDKRKEIKRQSEFDSSKTEESPRLKRRKFSDDDKKRDKKIDNRREMKGDRKTSADDYHAASAATNTFEENSTALSNFEKWPSSHQFALLSFVYFDLNHVGYIMEKDLEDIVHIIGLYVSRAQVRKLVQKVSQDEKVAYKKVLKLSANLEQNGNKKQTEDDQNIVRGNNHLTLPGKEMLKQERQNSMTTVSAGLVTYNGALVDVASMMKQLERSEQSRGALETRLAAIQHDLDVLHQKHGTLENSLVKNTEELEVERKKTGEQRKTIEQLETEKRRCRDVLNRSRAALSAVVNDMADTLSHPDSNRL